jgi:hypothetical protein
MTISYVAAGTLATGTTTATVTHPAGIVAGDLEIMQVITGHPSNLTASTPAGWEKIGELVGGDPGAYGVGTGPRRLALYTRIADATNPNPIITMPSATNVFVAARMFALHCTAGTGWRYVVTFGDDATSGTAVSALTAEAVTWLANDFNMQFFALPSSTPTMTAEAITATSVTFGATTERVDDAVAVGGTARLIMSSGSVTSTVGTPSSAPTITGTLSVASFAVGAVLRVREATATITATVQSAFPPRVLVAVAGMLIENIVSITIERSSLNELTLLRAAVDADVTSLDAFVRTDGEMPFGAPVSYVATLKDSAGDEWQIISNSVTTNVTDEVLSDAVLGLGVAVQIIDWKQRRYERETTTFNISGRLVVVSGPNPGSTSDLTVFTKLTSDRDDMLALLDRATSGIVQIRTQAVTICLDDPGYDAHAQVDTYLAVTSTVLERVGKFRYPQRNWQLSVAEVDPWLIDLEARGWTYADIDGFFTDQTYSAFDLQFNLQTYLAIDIRDWGV